MGLATDRDILAYLRRAKDDESLAEEVPVTTDESGRGAALLAREAVAPFVPVPPALLAEIEQLRYLAHRGWVLEHDSTLSLSRAGARALDKGLA
jgi:hypothetical protein